VNVKTPSATGIASETGRILVAASFAAALLYWLLQGLRPYPGSLPLKLLPLLLLLPGLWSARHAPAARLVFCALCAHMLGDAVLEWDRSRMLLAIGPFLLGHALTACAWWQLRRPATRAARWRQRLLLAGGLGLLAFLLPHLRGVLPYAVPLYVAILLGMGWLAQQSGQSWIALGAISYVISDALIAISNFVAPLPYELYLTWPTYYLAQLLMTQGLLRRLQAGL